MAQLAQVLKYEGDNNTFVWKHPIEDFNVGTQLIVHEAQEALFFLNGQALDLFGPGRHTLETQNLPLVGKLLNRPTGDSSPFHCEIYFINKVEQMAIKWGTDSKVEYMEPTYQFPIQIGASGEMSLRAENSRQLLIKLVGTEHGLSQKSLVEQFRSFLMTKIKTYLAQIIRQQKINIFEIDEWLTVMSQELHGRLTPDFREYGVSLEHFFVTTVVKPEEDRSYQKFKELHFRQYADIAEAKLRQQVGVIDQQTQTQRMIIESQGLATKRTQEGYTYQQERRFDVAEQMAANEAVGQMSNLGVGLGVMAGISPTVGNMVGGVVEHALVDEHAANSAVASACSKCGEPLPAQAKFCPNCGEIAKVSIQKSVTCPACGEKTPSNPFCIFCGAPLEAICPKCGAKMPPQGKFCPECGTSR